MMPEPATSPEPKPAASKGPGCLMTFALTGLAALLIAGVIAWKFFDASLGFAKQGWSFFSGLPEKFQTHRITETFLESITRIDSTDGDVLELATMETMETITKFDMKMALNDLLYLGTTESEIRTPVVYRFHLKLSDDWRLTTNGNVLRVVAPVIRPSLPPAIRTEGMEKHSESGWLRFNAAENLAALEKNLTPTLEKRAGSPAKIKQVREICRKSVAEFVRKWLLREEQWREGGITTIVVVFADEPEAGAPEKVEAATIHLHEPPLP